jgi:hypothetical protein
VKRKTLLSKGALLSKFPFDPIDLFILKNMGAAIIDFRHKLFALQAASFQIFKKSEATSSVSVPSKIWFEKLKILDLQTE